MRLARFLAVVAFVLLVGCTGGKDAPQAEAPPPPPPPALADVPDPLQATDCVAFVRDVYRWFQEKPPPVRSPGTRPRLQPVVFWFGPRLGKRRANTVIENPELHVGDVAEKDERYAMYWISYQVPSHGCRTGAVPGSDNRLPNWGPGLEMQVMTIPLDSAEARLQLRNDDTMRVELRGPVVRTADGRKATITRDDGYTVWVVVSGRVVMFQRPDDVGVRAAVRRLRAIERMR
jgi:hypothetical protein